MKMCHFLKSREEVFDSMMNLEALHISRHHNTPKNWDLIHIVTDIADGNMLDMGSSDSLALLAAQEAGIHGLKIGIDLTVNEKPIPGCAYMVGDLTNTKIDARKFNTITCLSVIEHGVDIPALAAEASRLLVGGGRFYLTFDYWEPKVTQWMRMYGVRWWIFCRQEIELLVQTFKKYGLELVEEIDWTLGDPVIDGKTWGPTGCVPYTFGILTFVKQ